MSEELIKSLNARIQELTGENVRRKQAYRDAVKERDAIKAKLDEAAKSQGDGSKALEKAQARIAELEQAVKDAPGKAAERIKELEQEKRTAKHKAAFDKLAQGKLKDDPRARDDAYGMLGWDADTDEPDESKLGEALDRLIAEREYLKAEPVGSKTSLNGHQQSSLNPRPPGPGHDRGAAPGTASEIKSPTGDAMRIA